MKVFLSYASEDRKVAGEIAEVLREEGHDVYPAAHWPQSIRAALDRADAFVVLLSPAAVGSPYVSEEINHALGSERFENRMIPVVLNRSTQIPWILQTMQPIQAKPPRTAAEMINKRLQRQGATDAAAR